MPQTNYALRSLLEVADLQIKRSTSGNTARCHSCGGILPIQFITICSSKDCKCTGYCSFCLQKLFYERLTDTLRDPDWVCPLCKKCCCCHVCLPPDTKASEDQQNMQSPQHKRTHRESFASPGTTKENVTMLQKESLAGSAGSFGETLTSTSASTPPASVQPPPPLPVQALPSYREQMHYGHYIYGITQPPFIYGERLPKRRKSSSISSSSSSSSSSSRSSSASSSSLSSSSSSTSRSSSPHSRPHHGRHRHHSDRHRHRHGSHRHQYAQSQTTKHSHHRSDSQRRFVHPLATQPSAALAIPITTPPPQAQQPQLQPQSTPLLHEQKQEATQQPNTTQPAQQPSQHHHHYHTQHSEKKRTKSRSRSSSKPQHSNNPLPSNTSPTTASSSSSSLSSSSSSSLPLSNSGSLSPSVKNKPIYINIPCLFNFPHFFL